MNRLQEKRTMDSRLRKGEQKALPAEGSNGVCPYEYLYAYVLNSVLAPHHESRFGETFAGNWVEEDTSFLFFTAPADEAVEDLMRAAEGLEVTERHVFPYEVWQGGAVEPVRVDDFVIVPPWLNSGADDGGIKIVIDPGVVFGNCLHPTTRDCLRALTLAASRCELGRVVDLGTGTGALAIAAALLGADKVLAIDLNPLCVRTAQKNVGLNTLTNIEVVEGAAQQFALERAELLVANIHHAVIMDILKEDRLAAIQRVIVSGLLRSQVLDVKLLLKKKGYKPVRQWDSEMTWFTLLADKVRNASVSNHGISL